MAEIERRLVHASGTAAPASYLLGVLTWEQLGWLLWAGCLLTFILEAIRLRMGLDWWIYEKLTREYERDNVAGYALYMFSLAAIASVFRSAVAVPAMLMLSIGDPVGGYLGEGGRRKPLVAIAAVFVVCFLVAIPFLPPGIAVLGAVVATIADGYQLSVRSYVIDDNLTIPIGAALAMAAGVAYFSI